MRSILLMAAMLATSGCTFVHLAPGAGKVSVLATAPSGCAKRGEVEVSVKDRVGPYARSEAQVRDELETLARNEAPGLGGDSVQPLDGPEDGRQRYAVWRCRG